jgi:hypothetical protein
MEFKSFDYSSKPISFSKNYDIYTLSNKGINQYVSPDSYIHKYIDKKNLNNYQRYFSQKKFIINKEIITNQNIQEDNQNNDYEIKYNINNYNDLKSNSQKEEIINKTQNGIYTNFQNNEKKSRPFSSMVMNKSICSFYGKSSNFIDLKRLQYKKSIYHNSIEYHNNIRFEKSFFSNSNLLSSKDNNNLNKKNINKIKSFQGIHSLKNLKIEKENSNNNINKNVTFRNKININENKKIKDLNNTNGLKNH